MKTCNSSIGLAAAALLLGSGAAALAAEGQIVELTQTACQFVESENGVDRGYVSKSADDCDAINAQSGAERLAEAKVLELPPGKYTFRVNNKNVPYELGFWLRDADYNPNNPLHHLSKTSVSGGGLTEGATEDYVVDLKPGEYVYSCPLNPTPNYRLLVRG